MAGLGMTFPRDKNLGSRLERALHQLLGGNTEDVLQLMVHLVHPIGGGPGQSVQECHCRSHVLAGLGEGWTR
jgi:hypothetical protein